MLQLIEAVQAITHTIQTPFKPSFPNSIFQILKVRILVDGFTDVIDFLKLMELEPREGRIGFFTFRRKGLGMVSRVQG